MAAKTKPQVNKPGKKIPPPGRKMSKSEAREYVFKTYRKTMEMLAKH